MNDLVYYQNKLKKIKEVCVKDFDNDKTLTLYHMECVFVICEELICQLKELKDEIK